MTATLTLQITSKGRDGDVLVIRNGDRPIGAMQLWRNGAVVTWQGHAYEIETHNVWKHSWVLDEDRREVGRATERPLSHHHHEWDVTAAESTPAAELVSGWTPGGMEIHEEGNAVGVVEPEPRSDRFLARLPVGLPESVAVLLIFVGVAAERGHLPPTIHRPHQPDRLLITA